MHKKLIETELAPKAVGPYSQGVYLKSNDMEMIFVSGQLPVDPSTSKMVEGPISFQLRQAIKNMESILQTQGLDLSHVVRVDLFLTNLDEYADMNKEYHLHFKGPIYPARQAIEVSKLPLNSKLEISCIAIKHH